jgi:hypothetical protein
MRSPPSAALPADGAWPAVRGVAAQPWPAPRRGGVLPYVAALVALGAAAPLVPRVVLVAFTPLAVAVGWLCLRRSPALYVQLSLWVVFLSPLLRRIVDYEIGYRATNPILLAPLLVPGLTLLPLLERARALGRRDLVPYALALAGVACGFVVGVLKLGLLVAGYGVVTWIVPLAFGCFVALRADDYPEMRRSLTRAFVLALLLVGAYAVAQFVWPPPWDVYWVVNGGQSAVLDPRPLHLRIFGPLNSFGPLAAVLLAGLIVALSSDAPIVLRTAAALVGALALMLTQVRAAWGGLLIAVLLLVAFTRRLRRLRTLAVLAIPAALLPLVLAMPEASVVRARLDSLGRLDADQSYLERQAYRAAAWNAILTTPEGEGTGATGMAWVLTGRPQDFTVEQGEQDALYSLGWVGGTLYLAGVLALMWRTAAGGEARDDRFGRAARCAALALFLVSLLGNVFVAVGGTLFWTFVGAHVAARRHARLSLYARASLREDVAARGVLEGAPPAADLPRAWPFHG